MSSATLSGSTFGTAGLSDIGKVSVYNELRTELVQNGYITGTTSVTMGEPGVNQDACKLVSPRLIVTVS